MVNKFSVLVEDIDQAKIVIDDEYGMKASEQDFKGYSFPLIITSKYNTRRGHYWALKPLIKYDTNKHITFEEWINIK